VAATDTNSHDRASVVAFAFQLSESFEMPIFCETFFNARPVACAPRSTPCAVALAPRSIPFAVALAPRSMAAPVLSSTVGDLSVAWLDSACAVITNRQPLAKRSNVFNKGFNVTLDLPSLIRRTIASPGKMIQRDM
jgi:hypothetical protein